ncbi:Zinc finger protein 862, partial [Frankliniella fusca]
VMDFNTEDEWLVDDPNSPADGETRREGSDNDGEMQNKRSRRSTTPVSRRRYRGELSSAEKKAEQRVKTFQESWLHLDIFKDWLRRVPDNPEKARCRACNAVMNAGKSELEKHAQGKKHKELLASTRGCQLPLAVYEGIYITSNISNMEEYMVIWELATPRASIMKNRTLDALVDQQNAAMKHTENVKVAEIKLASFFVDTNVAFNASDKLVAVSKQAFKDSKIAKDVTLGRDKCNAIVRNVIAKTETELLVQDLKVSLFSIMVDESTEHCSDKSMCVVVRYIYSKTQKPRNTLLELVRLDARDCSAEKLWAAFEKCLQDKEIPVTNCVGMGCDSAAVMVGSNNSFWSRLKSACPWAILIPCSCHSSASVSSYACAKLPAYVEEHLRLLSKYLRGSPKRSAELQEFQQFHEEQTTKMVKPSATRWLVLHACVDKYLEMRAGRALLGYFELRCFEDREKRDKDAHKILAELKNPWTKAYMQFLSYTLNVMNEFNGLFQSRTTLIHKLYELSHNLMKTLCLNYLKPEVLDRLATINVSHPDYLLPDDDIVLGPDCDETLQAIRPPSETPEGRAQLKRDLAAFKKQCLGFYITAATEIQKRLPLKNEMMKEMSFLDPQVFLDLSARSGGHGLKGLPLLTANFKDKLKLDSSKLAFEWRRLPVEITGRLKDKLLSAETVEDVWVEEKAMKTGAGDQMFPNLCKLADVVMIQPHSDAESERVFSIVTDVHSKKRNRLGAEALNAICVSRSSFRSIGIDCTTFQVGPNHLKKHNSSIYDRS